jgi:hypothetical protein
VKALGQAMTGVHTNGKHSGLGGMMGRLFGNTKSKKAEENGRG